VMLTLNPPTKTTTTTLHVLNVPLSSLSEVPRAKNRQHRINILIIMAERTNIHPL
jgi:hypothetical protein